MPQSVISVVLLPNDDDRHLLERLSALIDRSAHSSLRLGEHSLPHITVAQFAAPREAASELWETVQDFTTLVTDLIASGLAFVPEGKYGRIWVEVGFLKSARLEQLQTRVLSTEFSTKFSLLHNHVGELYRPHCTLALLEGDTIPVLQLEDARLLRRTYSQLTLAVGLNGENFTLSKILHAA